MTMTMPFTKMQGAGNDFVFLNLLDDNLSHDFNFNAFSKRICHRHFGIGADQVILVQRSTVADFRMVIHNADGGEVEMCGNAVRCFAKYVRDKNLTKKSEIKIETRAGMIVPKVILNHPRTTGDTMWVRVDMGEPRDIVTDVILSAEKDLLDKPGSFFATLRMTTLSMGNPHAVVFVDDVSHHPVRQIGHDVEHHPFFPERTNVEFVQVKTRGHVVQRTWERGVGETLACGTGACAVCVAGVVNGVTDRKLVVSLPGGDLDIEWDATTNHIFKTGPATTVFEGIYVGEGL